MPNPTYGEFRDQSIHPGAALFPFSPTPADAYGLIGMTADPMTVPANATPGAATIYLQRIELPPGAATLTNAGVIVQVAGNAYTNTQLGVYAPNGTFLRATAVLAAGGTNTFGTVGFKSVALSTPVTVDWPWVWVGVHFGSNPATSVALRGGSFSPSNGINLGLPAAKSRVGTFTGHATNDLATIGNITPSSISQADTVVPIWASLS